MASQEPIPDPPTANRFRPNAMWYTQALGEAACLIGGAWVFHWMYHTASDSLQRFTVVALLVLAAPFVIFWLGRIAWLFWRCTRRYKIHGDAITVRHLFFTRQMRREDITDFDLLPNTFPKPPRAIVLHDNQGNRLKLDTSFKPKQNFLAALAQLVPALAEHGTERVRVSTHARVPSVLRVRSRLHNKELLMIFIGGILALVGALVCLWIGWKQVDRLRIQSDPVVIEGTIVEVDVQRGKHGPEVFLTVEYSPGDGKTYTTRRHADAKMAGIRPGTKIQIQYRRNHPQTARLLDHDHDDNEYGELIIFCLWTYFFTWAFCRAVMAWLGPLRKSFTWELTRKQENHENQTDDESMKALMKSLWEPITWGLVINQGKYAIKTNEQSLETLVQALPQPAPSGAAVLTSLFAERIGVLTSQQAKALTRAGLECERVVDKYILLPGQSSRQLIDRLNWRGNTKADLIVLKSDGIDDAATWTRALEDGPDSVLNLASNASIHWYHQDKHFGPIEEHDTTAAFDRWVKAHFLELFDHPSPPALDNIRFTELLGLDVINRRYRLLAERTRSGLRLWARDRENGQTLCAESVSGRWMVIPHTRAPRAIREDPLIKRIAIGTLALIFLPIVLLVLLIFMPLIWLDERSKRRKVQAKLQQLEQNDTPKA